MSRINRFRIINLSYNNNANRVDDECFDLGGESTLFSLRNGGGKSVLVQMLIAMFVHKRYRDTEDRPFASYFTTGRPTHLLAEWVLDGGVGFVLTGMMVQKRQPLKDEDSQKEENRDELEIIQFIKEYGEDGDWDIKSIPVLTDTERGKAIKGFGACAQIFDKWKNDKSQKFFAYNMTVPAQAAAYYKKLEEYQIFYKEWEGIIKTVNKKESGLSDLFKDSKDEKGLVDKWFLDVVEKKLNKEENRMKKFEKLTKQFIFQYKENKSKIEKQSTVLLFQDAAGEVMKEALAFHDALEEEAALKNKIGSLFFSLDLLRREQEEKRNEIAERIEALNRQVRDLKYDSISCEIYDLKEEKWDMEQQQLFIAHRIKSLREEKKELERKKHILECARLYEDYKRELKDTRFWENKRELLTRREKDLLPEKERLGYTLGYLYEKEYKERQEKLGELEETLSQTKGFIENSKERIRRSEILVREKTMEKGQLWEKIKSFDKEEMRFNQRYKETLARNIVGEYEAGFLEVKEKEELLTQEEEKRKLSFLKKEKDGMGTELYNMTRQMEDIRLLAGGLENKLVSLLKEEEDYEEQLKERHTLLLHIGYPKEKIFDTEGILKEYYTKWEEIQIILRRLSNEKEKKEEEYKRLESGRVLELPKDLERAMAAEGIQITFGMEWLKKNGRTPKENQETVKANPFLPYGIILEDEDMNRLIEKELGVFTSFPIPLIRRKALSSRVTAGGRKVLNDSGRASGSSDNSVSPVAFNEKVGFYVLFNDKLLDERELKALLEKKREEIKRIERETAQREEEAGFYQERREMILKQSLTKEGFEGCKNNIEKTRKEIKKKEEEELLLRSKKKELETGLKEMEKEISNFVIRLERRQEKLKDLKELIKRYEEYMENRTKSEELKAILDTVLKSIDTDKTAVEEKKEEQEALKDVRRVISGELSDIWEKVKQYEPYGKQPLYTLSLEEAEARFLAMSGEMSAQEQEAGEQLKKAAGRLDKVKEELSYKEKHYFIKEEDYKEQSYDRLALESLEKEADRKQEEADKESLAEGRLGGNIIRVSERISIKLESMKKELGQTEPRKKEEIVRIDFESAIARKNHEITQKVKEEKETSMSLSIYESNLSGLAEFSDLKVESTVLSLDDLKKLGKDEWMAFRGGLLRDYNHIKNVCRDKQAALAQAAEKLGRREEFAEPFFAKPIHVLMELTGMPDEFMAQLNITMESYGQLLEKLRVDIEVIEKEKSHLEQMFLDYLEDIHKNLEKIDKNSTIKIRERPVKMFRMILPDWEDNERLYRERLGDYFKDLTERGIKRLEANENIEEMISAGITTKKLYDTVAGIHNIQIKLYKIEAQREYPITWAQVAKNSGGEGFLSAFVVLSSLLSFMRRDDTDIFAQKEQGKVLVMDNPFAQTSSAHLLKPLMDMAKKVNTQLICLTALGGEDIYNRFDNIYVLGIKHSKLHGGAGYLKGKHIKGEEAQASMAASRIKTEEMEQVGMFTPY